MNISKILFICLGNTARSPVAEYLARYYAHKYSLKLLITRKLIEKQDLILTIENSHKKDILQNYRNIFDIQNKVFTIKEFNGETTDIDIIDPYYASKKTYQKVLATIDENVKKALKIIAKSNK
ncbi:MAG: hypothetical protein P8Y23_06660 [Candidatus Lokiarchaeota archaeon]